ncbi:MAG: glycosyltransferase family A protein [Chthoniobacteraceae bacterium]
MIEPLVAPLAGGFTGTSRSWAHRVTACIAHLETPEPLRVCIELLRAQTERPYIIVVDTGSSLGTQAELAQMRAADVEIHLVRGHSYRHASEPVAVALDLAHARCHTEFLFHTHSDVFLQRFDFLSDLLALCTAANPVVGYRMTERHHPDWKHMVGHTSLMLHMPTINRAGAQWSMQRAHDRYGIPWCTGKPGWPDTETGFNYDLWAAGIAPLFIEGQEKNFECFRDANINHVRSYPGAKQYSPAHFARAEIWMRQAMDEARALLAAR